MIPTATLVKAARTVSYALLATLFLLIITLHLGPLLLAVLFGYFILDVLRFGNPRRKWLAVTLFVTLVTCAIYAFGFFIKEFLNSLPEIVDKGVPSVIRLANDYGMELPFTDYESLRSFLMETVKDQLRFLGVLARSATLEMVYLAVGLVAAISLFLHPRMELDRPAAARPGNLYSLYCDEMGKRVAAFYRSFATVMGAQIAISAINTLLTAVFVLATGMPHPIIILGVTFLCGLLPVIGNLVSNTIITIIGFTVSSQLAISALLFLVAVHKLEYFLNSRIIGARIRNPVWLMLLGLLVGERVMGLSGMILAPVVLYYLKVEIAKLRVGDDDDARTAPAPAPPAQ